MARYDQLTRADLVRLLSETEAVLRAEDGDESRRLVHELQQHKIELEIQNLDLRSAQQALEETRDRYAALYDFAPVGYLTLDRNGLISNLNLTAAAFLGKERARLLGSPLGGFLVPGSRGALFEHLRAAFGSGERTVGQIDVRVGRLGPVRQARLDSTVQMQADAESRCLTILTDVTDRNAIDRRLRDSHQRLSTLFNAAPIGIGVVCRRVLESVSPRFLEMIGYTEAELVGHSARMLYGDDAEFERVGREKYAQLDAYGVGEVETRMRCKDGVYLDVLLRSVPLDRDDPDSGVIFTVLDISERKRADDQLRQTAAVVRSTVQGVVITDLEGRITDVNDAFTQITGYARAQVIGQNPRILQSGRHDRAFYDALWHDLTLDGSWSGEIWNRRKDGVLYPELLTISVVAGAAQDEPIGYVGVFSDITMAKQSEQRLEHMASYDPLTELPNRLLLLECLRERIEYALRNQTRLAVAFLDLDRFKQINDSMGHDVGDDLLMELAQRLRNTLRPSDMVARMSGDEFVLLLDDIGDAANARLVVEHVMRIFHEPFQLGAQQVRATASIGVSLCPDDGGDASTLLRHADAAMYQSKDAGRNTYGLYSAEMTATALEQLLLGSALHAALENGQFFLVYQPQVDLASGRYTGVEALLRWRHPEMGLVPPSRFIPLAEKSGLIWDIGAWVLNQACAQSKAWHGAGIEVPRVGVNIAGPQIAHGGLIDLIERMLEKSAVPPVRLALEVTESFLMSHTGNNIRQLELLDAMGIEIEIDDFGTGYSSLSYLKRLPVKRLKLDQSFVAGIPDDPDDNAIAEAIIALGRALRMGVIAEGVETQEQADFLRELGCQEAQGYLFSKPVSPEEISTLFSAAATRQGTD